MKQKYITTKSLTVTSVTVEKNLKKSVQLLEHFSLEIRQILL